MARRLLKALVAAPHRLWQWSPKFSGPTLAICLAKRVHQTPISRQEATPTRRERPLCNKLARPAFRVRRKKNPFETVATRRATMGRRLSLLNFCLCSCHRRRNRSQAVILLSILANYRTIGTRPVRLHMSAFDPKGAMAAPEILKIRCLRIWLLPRIGPWSNSVAIVLALDYSGIWVGWVRRWIGGHHAHAKQHAFLSQLGERAHRRNGCHSGVARSQS